MCIPWRLLRSTRLTKSLPSTVALPTLQEQRPICEQQAQSRAQSGSATSEAFSLPHFLGMQKALATFMRTSRSGHVLESPLASPDPPEYVWPFALYTESLLLTQSSALLATPRHEGARSASRFTTRTPNARSADQASEWLKQRKRQRTRDKRQRTESRRRRRGER